MTGPSTVFVSAELPADLRAGLEERYRVVDVPPGTVSQLAEYGAPAGWLVRGGTRVTPEVLDQLPTLRIISNHGAGYESIDVAAASGAGVVVANAAGVLDDAVAELTFGLIIALGRNIFGADRFVRSGTWAHDRAPLTRDVHGKTLGILGMGQIGQRVAELARAFKMDVIYHNRHPATGPGAAAAGEWVTKDELLRRSDFVSVHAPLTPQTTGLVGRAELMLMKSSAFLLNMARGAVVDTDALVHALQDGKIAGAALDVFDVEPLPPTHPLLALDTVIVQPHAGSATVETRRAMAKLAIRNLEDGLRGKRPKTALNWDDVEDSFAQM